MSTASSLGKLIKLKCLTGNHAKVKEMLCKLLLAPTFLGVRRRLSADVCGLGSGADEQSWNVENWIVTVDFAACISGRKWTFNNSTIWGPGLCFVRQRSQAAGENGIATCWSPSLRFSEEKFFWLSSQLYIIICIISFTIFNECRCFHTEHKESLNGLMSIKWCVLYAMAFTVTRAQPN